MFINVLQFLNLVAFGFVASQPIFYLMAMSQVQKNLQAPSYVELRNLIDKHINVNNRIAYYLTLITSFMLVVSTAGNPVSFLFISSLTAFIALVADIILSVRGNVPLNKIIQRWTPQAVPLEWQKIRQRWFLYYHYRQIAGILGFISLLAGASFG